MHYISDWISLLKMTVYKNNGILVAFTIFYVQCRICLIVSFYVLFSSCIYLVARAITRYISSIYTRCTHKNIQRFKPLQIFHACSSLVLIGQLQWQPGTFSKVCCVSRANINIYSHIDSFISLVNRDISQIDQVAGAPEFIKIKITMTKIRIQITKAIWLIVMKNQSISLRLLIKEKSNKKYAKCKHLA